MYILGAGMAGCLAGILNNDAIIFERSVSPDTMLVHKALLRFRSDKIGKICGVDFEKVIVRKSIHYENKEYRTPTLRLANLYSKKVSNGYYSRSILDLADAERYIAPENFHEILLNKCKDRIRYNHKVISISKESLKFTTYEISRLDTAIISTIPMNVLCGLIGIKETSIIKNIEFHQSAIHVTRYRIRNCSIFQTVYYPDPSTTVYRASILRDLLIIERMIADEILSYPEDEDEQIIQSLGIQLDDLEPLDESQQLGKIAPIAEDARKNIILHATMNFNVYSLGRFSVWRNILLDDVYEDILKIRQLSNKPKYDVYLNS